METRLFLPHTLPKELFITFRMREQAIKWWNNLGNNPLSRLTTKHHSFDRKPSSLTGREIQEIMESEAIEWWDLMNFEDQFFSTIKWLKSNNRDTTERHPHNLTREEIAEIFCFLTN